MPAATASATARPRTVPSARMMSCPPNVPPGATLDGIPTLSFPTVGLMVELAGEMFEPDNLAPLMMRCDLWHVQGGESLKRAVLNNVLAARGAAQDGDLAAHRSLLRLAQQKRANHPLMSPRQVAGLRVALLADGYEMTWEHSPLPHDYTATYTVRPTDAALFRSLPPVPLALLSRLVQSLLPACGDHGTGGRRVSGRR